MIVSSSSQNLHFIETWNCIAPLGGLCMHDCYRRLWILWLAKCKWYYLHRVIYTPPPPPPSHPATIYMYIWLKLMREDSFIQNAYVKAIFLAKCTLMKGGPFLLSISIFFLLRSFTLDFVKAYGWWLLFFLGGGMERWFKLFHSFKTHKRLKRTLF